MRKEWRADDKLDHHSAKPHSLIMVSTKNATSDVVGRELATTENRKRVYEI